MTTTELSLYVRRAEKLSVVLGANNDEEDGRFEVDTSKMNAWEKSRFEIAMLISQVREDSKHLDDIDTGDTRKKAALSNRIRRNIKEMKSKCTNDKVKKMALRQGSKEEYDDMVKHARNAEALFRQRYRHIDGEASPSPTATDETTGLADYRGGMDNYGGADDTEPMLNPEEEEEFQQFYEQTKMRDQRIDQGFKMVSQGLERIKQNALATADEIERQNVMLDNANERAEVLAQKLTGLNSRLHQTLKEVDKEKYCCYIICMLLVLGVLGVLFAEAGIFRKH